MPLTDSVHRRFGPGITTEPIPGGLAGDVSPATYVGSASRPHSEVRALGVADLRLSRAFYLRALAPLGFVELGVGNDGRSVAFGPTGLDDFIISVDYPVGASIHVAFAADSQEQVDAFHAAAMAAGGRDNGPPGIRPEYSTGYYGAFVFDPDGNNVEAVHYAA